MSDTDALDLGALERLAKKYIAASRAVDIAGECLALIARLREAEASNKQMLAMLSGSGDCLRCPELRDRIAAAEARVAELDRAVLWMRDYDPQLVEAAEIKFALARTTTKESEDAKG